MKSFFVLLLIGLFFILALLFGAKNEQMVTVSYFIAEGEYRLPLVLAIVFFAGFALSWLFASFYLFRMKMALRKSQKALAKLQKEMGIVPEKTTPTEKQNSVA